MKSVLLFASAFVLSISAFADQELIIEDKATIKVCQKGVMGCANRIIIQGNPYIISYNEASNVENGITNLITAMVSACKSMNVKVTPEFQAEGFFAKEKGHMPNPTVEFDVFKLSYVAGVMIDCQ